MAQPFLEIERFLLFAHKQVQGATWRAMSGMPIEGADGHSYSSTYDLLASSIASEPNVGSVLEVACGDGRLLDLIASRIEGTVALHGIDISPEELRDAHERLGGRASLCIARAQSLPFEPASFDCVTSHMALMLMEDEEGVASEIARVLRPNGVLHAIVSGPSESCAIHDLFVAQLRGTSRSAEWQRVRFISKGYSSPHAIRDTLRHFPEVSIQSLRLSKTGTPEDAWSWFGGMYDLLLIGEDQAAAVRARFFDGCTAIAKDGQVSWSINVSYVRAGGA